MKERAMPSDYAVVTDGAVTLPADNDDLDVDFNFDAPGILNLQPVLLYRVDPTPNLLTLEVNIQLFSPNDGRFTTVAGSVGRGGSRLR
jgi:hypothetical protein